MMDRFRKHKLVRKLSVGGSAADRSKSGLGSGSAFFFDGFKLNPGIQTDLKYYRIAFIPFLLRGAP
jgi:hypothetical protein